MVQQRGATLIEVLITLLILKVGFLGALAGQLLALKIVTDASQRTTALALSQDILPQLAAFNGINPASDFTSKAHHNIRCEASAPCTYPDARQHILASWQQKWQTNTSYGFLLVPEFCVTQQAGRISLKASWLHSAATQTVVASPCAAGVGRSALYIE